jgi:large repetitive protein
VQVTGVADVADLSVDTALLTTTYSATAVPLSSSTLAAIQSGYTVTISGVPTGATLNYGTDNGNGTWTVPGANAGSLTITPAANYSGSLNLSATVNNPSGGTTTAFTAGFNTSSDSFTYSDGSFGGSTSTSLAAGSRSSNELRLDLGGATTASTMSGGFSRAFTTTGSGSGTVTFSYRVDATDIESSEGEYARVMVAIDGTNKGSGSNTYVAQVTQVDSGWVTVTVNLGTLAAGSHTLTIGGLLNKADNSNDDVEMYFDNVTVGVSAPSTVTTQSNIAVTPTVASYTYDLNVAAALTDATGETLSVTIGALPSGVALNHGTQNADGSWTVASSDLADLTVSVPKTAAAFELSVSAATSDGGDVVTITKTLDFSDHKGLDTADTLTGTTGDDTQYGGAGNDTINAGAGNDTAWGGSGDDTINAGDGNDYVYGGSGADTIFGGNGIDYLSGGEGGDIIKGDAGNDIIIGGAGNDTLYGGADADNFKFNLGDGNDTIMDFGSSDQLTFGGISLNAGDSVGFAASGNDVVITIIGQDGTQANQVTLKDAAAGMSTAEREHISDGYSVTDTGNGVSIVVDQNS